MPRQRRMVILWRVLRQPYLIDQVSIMDANRKENSDIPPEFFQVSLIILLK